MRQRAKRDLTAILGVIVVLAIVVLVNYNFTRGALAKAKDKERSHWEQEREQKDHMTIMKWHTIMATTGNLRKGANFTDELKKWDNKQVNLIGFMVPENQFRNISDFIILPLPIECYFCDRPPVEVVVNVQMEKGKTCILAENPILVNGVLRLHQGPNQQYFYSIDQAAVVAAQDGARLEKRYMDPRHMMPRHSRPADLEKGVDFGKVSS